jgi:hypothetical protein
MKTLPGVRNNLELEIIVMHAFLRIARVKRHESRSACIGRSIPGTQIKHGLKVLLLVHLLSIPLRLKVPTHE